MNTVYMHQALKRKKKKVPKRGNANVKPKWREAWNQAIIKLDYSNKEDKYIPIDKYKGGEIMQNRMNNIIIDVPNINLIENKKNKTTKPFKSYNTQSKYLIILYNKIIINIANNIAKCIKKYGIFHDIEMIDLQSWNTKPYTIQDNYYFFIFLPHLVTKEVPYTRSFIYLLEQNLNGELNNVYTDELSKNKIFKKLIQTSILFDYSQTNIDIWNKQSLIQIRKKIVLLPPPLPECIDFVQHINDDYYDILFFGLLNERRKHILKHISKTFKIKVINYTKWGEELIHEIKKSKIVLNIHYYDNAILEKIRINEVIPYARIVSEMPCNDDISSYESYKDIVDFVPFIKTSEHLALLSTKLEVIMKHLNCDTVDHQTKVMNFIDENTKYDVLKNHFEYLKNDKHYHRYICNDVLDIIKNIKIGEFGTTLNNNCETILIEFRKFPHLEFLLRNTIIKFPYWNHTIVCGNINEDFIRDICFKICNGTNGLINIIKLNIDNLDPSSYSALLGTKSFWNHFRGEKLLIYQEDTMLFHNNIEPFLQYDYIGAPWPLNQDDNNLGVGNGGFSLRSKSAMLKCIDTIDISDVKELNLGLYTLRYMQNTNSYVVPEDVYFSKLMIDHHIGTVAKRNVALQFSQETQKGDNPLGGHNFWLANNKINKKYINIFKLKTNYYKTCNHRYGWKSVIDSLYKNNILIHNNVEPYINEIDFVDCTECYFLWNKHHKQLKNPWYGVIHYIDELPDFYNRYETLDGLFDVLKGKLKNCKGIITLSNDSKKSIITKLMHRKYIDVPVYSLKHPIPKIGMKFNLNIFIGKEKYKIIQLGKQYRRVSDIYMIQSSYEKVWLSGWRDIEKCNYILNKECKFLNITPKNSVQCYFTETEQEYDDLLLNNIVLVPLWNATANNSLLECMEMNIPAFISRLPSTEEYLGINYPMFYNNIQEIESIINNKETLHEKYTETYQYLTTMDKSEIRHEHFNSELLKIINQ
tara:strand:+ start:619 stop:3558 length:2940 start_codon:yes stop_codon:yes gene_type:complete